MIYVETVTKNPIKLQVQLGRKLTMTDKTTAVHVTHETVDKVGGIGAVLQGFF
jgi:hypothetical protein